MVARTARPATMAPATIQGLVPAGCVVGSEDVVVPRGDVVVVVLAVGASDDARKATTRFDVGAKRRPAPTDGVGKWFAGAPIVACSVTFPDVGLRP
jgi:hypothetical protein